MNIGTAKSRRKSPAQWTGAGSFVLAACLLPIHAAWAALPPAMFVLLCVAASLSPRSSFFLPVISRGSTGRPAVSLTFDDGPDPLTTPLLLDLLDRFGVKATFFVVGREARRHPELIRAILSRGHLIGNHSYSHSPFLMLRSYKHLYHEILTFQDILQNHGVAPLAFRPPVGLTNPKLGRVLSHLGMICVTFSCRAYDRGNRQIRGLAGKILRKVRPDDIVLLHDVRPPAVTDIPVWQKEVESILNGLIRRHLAVVPLDELIGRPVMAVRVQDHPPFAGMADRMNGDDRDTKSPKKTF